jgi:hypothetical protein
VYQRRPSTRGPHPIWRPLLLTLAAGTLFVLIQGGAGAGTPRAAGAATKQQSVLRAGNSLRPGHSLSSDRGAFTLMTKRNGDVVLAWFGRALWTTGTIGHPGARLTMQADGNLVLYSDKVAVWSSGTGGHPPAAFRLLLLRKGNAVIERPDGAAMWSSHSAPHGVVAAPSEAPAFAGDAPDPDVVRIGSTYYAFTTGTPLGNNL